VSNAAAPHHLIKCTQNGAGPRPRDNSCPSTRPGADRDAAVALGARVRACVKVPAGPPFLIALHYVARMAQWGIHTVTTTPGNCSSVARHRPLPDRSMGRRSRTAHSSKCPLMHSGSGAETSHKKRRSTCIGALRGALLLAFSFSTGAVIVAYAAPSRAAARSSFSLSASKLAPAGGRPASHSAPSRPPAAVSGVVQETGAADRPEDRNRPLPVPRVQHGAAVIERGSSTALRIYTDDNRRQIGMCRFPSACLDTQAALYLPTALKRFRAAVATKCGLSPERLKFYDQASDREMSDAALTRHHPDVHLAGMLRPLRYHMPHMVEDLLSDIFVLAPYLQRRSSAPWRASDPPFHPANTTVHCFEPDSSPHGARQYACGSSPPAAIGVLVEDRAADLGWGAGMFSLFGAPSSRAPLRMLYRSEAFAPEPAMDKAQRRHDAFLRKASFGRQTLFQPRRACFSSISVPAAARGVARGQTHGPPAVHNSVLFQHSNIQRTLPQRPPRAACRLNVTIVNRRERAGVTSGDPYHSEGRRIPNLDAVRDELGREAARVGVAVDVQVREDFGEITFRDQFEAMQRTHVLISVHGAELSNALFLRRGASVVEVYPFRYTPAVFAKMMGGFGLLHKVFIADPDEKAFRKCLLHFNKPNDASREAAERVVERFERRAAAFRAAKKSGDSQALGAYWESGDFVRMVRPCGRGQRLLVDAPTIARQALSDSAQLCYGKTKVRADEPPSA
jgi:hypothetical protein